MITEDIINFLKNVPPFQFLEEAVLENIAHKLTLEFYPKNIVILRQDGPQSDALRIIKKGGVKVSIHPEDKEEIIIDYRNEGDTFGFLSLIGKDKQKTTVTAMDDTICYLLGKNEVLSLIKSHTILTEYFLKAHFSQYIQKTYSEMHNKSLYYGGNDHLLFTTQVKEMASKKVITAGEDINIKDAALLMAEHKISSILVTDDKGLPTGIVTDKDLREKVVAKDRDTSEPVKNIMSLPLVRVDADDYLFEAVLKMIKYNIHHVIVVKDGILDGVITNHDLMILQGTSPISIVREIETQPTVEGLIPVSKKINNIVRILLKEGARAGNITRVISEVNDRLVRKIIELGEKQFGEPPVRYCWIVFGSEGRKEQTFKTDQDNALIYEDQHTPEEKQNAAVYFEKLTVFVKDALVKCGFPVCPGNYMASNPMWRQPLNAWKEYFTKWIYAPTSEAILFSSILFDFRPIYGEFTLAEKLRNHLSETIKNNEIFLKHMADMTVSLHPPLGFFKTFVVEKSGEHKNELNLKFKCIAPLIDIIRLFSLEKGVHATSSAERIAALKETHATMREYGEELEHVFEFLMLLRIHHQLEQLEKGIEPDNFINPEKLSRLETKTLKEACRLISKIQDSINRQYNPGIMI